VLPLDAVVLPEEPVDVAAPELPLEVVLVASPPAQLHPWP